MLHQSRGTGDCRRRREGREMFQHVAGLEGLVQISHGRAEAPHTETAGDSEEPRWECPTTAGQQHNLLLPQVLCQEEPRLAPLLLPIAAHI